MFQIIVIINYCNYIALISSLLEEFLIAGFVYVE